MGFTDGVSAGLWAKMGGGTFSAAAASIMINRKSGSVFV